MLNDEVKNCTDVHCKTQMRRILSEKKLFPVIVNCSHVKLWKEIQKLFTTLFNGVSKVRRQLEDCP